MSGEKKSKDLAGSKETKMPQALTKASTSSSSSALTNPSSLSSPLASDWENNDPQDAAGMKQFLRQIKIRPPRLFDPTKDRNFKSWLERIEFHLEVKF